MFWGDRYGKLTDPFGHSWSMATHKEDVAPAEMKKRMEAATAKMSEQRTKAAV
jgi:PhnB protein